ncbi:CHC2 zinc finger domain-containing protein [Amycolatopsis sp. NPDC004079]|uniref:CHC2 zinc finger domain-containing protein n=1 Tax=Amycolatopsis sp. NPDC004079 TaxID=3154549 RepID=UPI0033B5FD12
MVSIAVSSSEPPDAGGIVALVEQYVRLSPIGERQLRGDCPFCGSRMFRVRPDHNTFHCFACGEGGGVRRFAEKVGYRP